MSAARIADASAAFSAAKLAEALALKRADEAEELAEQWRSRAHTVYSVCSSTVSQLRAEVQTLKAARHPDEELAREVARLRAEVMRLEAAAR